LIRLLIAACAPGETAGVYMITHYHAAALKFQVLKDEWTRNPEDAQKTFDLLGSKDKELFSIEGSTKRFKDGYNYFGRHPETVLAFFKKHMGASV
jgi:hypothetical protein